MTDKITTQDRFYEEKLEELSEGLDLDQAYKDLSEAESRQTSGVTLEFKTYPIPGNPMTPDLRIECAVDDAGGHHHKHVYHILGCSQRAAEAIGKRTQKYCMDVLHPLEGDICGEFGENPLLRGTWDFLVWGVPALRSKEIHRMAIEAITGTFGGQ